MMTMHEKDRHDAWMIPAAVLAVVILGFGLRVFNLAHESAWLDEVFSLQCLNASDLASFLREDRAVDSPLMMPVYFVLEYAWDRLTGGSILAMRLLSVAFSILMLPMIFLFARRLYGAWTGVVASGCLAVSLVHIFFGQEIRMYSLLCLLVLLSVYTLWEGVRRPGAGMMAAHILVNGLLLWTHLMGGLLFLSEGLYLLLFHRARRQRLWIWFVFHGMILMSGAAWVTANGIPREASWMAPASLRELANTFLVFAGGRASNTSPSPYLPTGLTLDPALAVLIFLMTVWLAWTTFKLPTTTETQTRKEAFGLLALWLIVPPLALFVVSALWRPCFLYRYVIYSSLPMYIILAAAVTSLKGARARTMLCLLLCALYVHQLPALQGPFRPDYRAAAQQIERDGGADDPVLILKNLNAIPFRYQCRLPEARLVVFEGITELRDEAVRRSGNGQAVWVLMWRWDRTEEFEERMEALGMTVTLTTLGGMPPLHMYRVAALSRARLPSSEQEKKT